MSNEPKKLNLDLSSIVNLKAELLRKQEEFRSQKLAKSLKKDEYESHKTQSVWGKKNKTEQDKTGTSSEKTTNDINEEESEEKLIEKSKKMLESKAKYYDEVVSGKKQTEEGDEEIFLVDFDKKTIEESEKKLELEEEEALNKLKLKNEIFEEEYNRELKIKWDKESTENLQKETIHYQDIRYNEVRNMGVGNFQFSRDEEKRKEQMEFFKKIELEIKTSRIQNEIYRLKREKVLVERLCKVKRRRLLKFGYSINQIKEKCAEFDKEMDEIEKEINELEEALKDPELYESKQNEAETNIENFESYKANRKVILDREWDKPKLKEKMWVKHVEKLRMERNKRFAPPKAYEQTSKKKNKKKNKNKEANVEEVKQEQNKTEKSEFIGPNINLNNTPPIYPMFFYPPPPSVIPNIFPFPPPPPTSLIPQFFPMPMMFPFQDNQQPSTSSETDNTKPN